MEEFLKLVLVVGGFFFLVAIFAEMTSCTPEEFERLKRENLRAAADKHLNMTGYEFAFMGLRYAVDRSVLLAERIDREQWGSRDSNYAVVRRSLYLDTVLEQPFALEWEWNAYSPHRPIRQNHTVFRNQQQLLEYVQTLFPEKVEEIMEARFRFPKCPPTKAMIRRSMIGTRAARAAEEETE